MKRPNIKRVRGVLASFVNMFVPTYEDKSIEIYKYGKNNLLPNELLSALANSGVATRCMNKVAEYISSDGFVNEASGKMLVNETQTANDLLNKQAVYMAAFTGSVFHISRKGGKVSKVKSIPFQCIRKRLDGSFLYNPTYGQPKYDKAQEKIYPAFYGAELPTNLITDSRYQNGEILYVYRESPFSSNYPVPDYYSQIEDVKTSGELSKMDLELSLNGFMPSAIVTVVGNIDDLTKDDNGKTEMDYVREDFKAFTGEIKDERGASGRFKGLLMHAPTKEDLPQVNTFDAKSILDASNTKRDVVGREVCRLFGVHPVLIGYSDAAILGNQQALANCSIELNKVVNQHQRMLADAFKRMFPAMDWTISEYMPVSYVPDALLADMTQDERRKKFLGLPPLNNTNVSTNQ